MSGGVESGRRAAPLDSLSKEDLIIKCKSLLQLAQKAKQAKDDLAQKFEARELEHRKGEERSRAESEAKIQDLQQSNELVNSQKEDLEDLLKAKQRKLDRLGGENDNLIQQVQTFNQETKLNQQKFLSQEKLVADLRSKLTELEKKVSKTMELEASVICAKEVEKRLKEENRGLEARLKIEDGKRQELEDSLKVEKKLSADKNNQIRTLNAKVEELETKANHVNDIREGSVEESQKMKEKENMILSQEKQMQELVDSCDKNCIFIQELEAKLETTSKEISTSKAMAEEAEQRLTFLENEKKVLESTNGGLISELNELNGEMKKRGEKIASLEQTSMQRIQEGQNISQISEKLSQTANKLEQIKLDLKKSEDEKKHLEEILSTIRVESEEIKKAHLENKLMVDTQAKEISSLDYELAECRKELDKSKDAFDQLKAQSQGAFKLNIAKINDLTMGLEKANATISELNLSFKNSIEEVEKLKRELEEKKLQEGEEMEFMGKLTKTEEELILVKLENDRMVEQIKSELSTEKGKVENLLRENLVVEEERQKHSEVQKTLEERVSQQEIENSRLAEQLEKLIGESKPPLQSVVEPSVQSAVELPVQFASKPPAHFSSTVQEELAKSELKQVMNKIELLIKEIEEKNETVESLRDSVEKSKLLLKEEKSLHASTKNEFENKKQTIETLKTDGERAKQLLKEKEAMLESYQANISDVAKQAQMKANQCDELVARVDELIRELKQRTGDMESLDRLRTELQLELNSKTDNLESLGEVSRNLKTQIEKKISELEVSNSRVADLNRDLENSNKTYLELKVELEASNKKLIDQAQKIKEFSKDLEASNRRNVELSREMETMRNTSLSSFPDQDDSRSEMMSTSTVSKAEEISRMKDLEDSFEERYSKLKLIAIKLKKKVGEQTLTIQELEQRNRTKLAEPDNSALKDKLGALTKNFTSLQSQYDQAVDKIDFLEKQVKDLTKDMETVMSESMSNKEAAGEATQNLLSSKTELSRNAEQLGEKEKELSSLSTTLDQERKERKCLEMRLKNGDILEAQLGEKTGLIAQLEEGQQSLKLQVGQLEETLDKEQERANRSQSSLTATRAQLNEVEVELVKRNSETSELKHQLEETLKALEESKQEHAQLLSRTKRTEGEERGRVLQLERQVVSLESRLQSKGVELKHREEELDRLRQEFESYKVRAQSVLKQSKVQEEGPSHHQEELSAVEKLNEALTARLKQVGLELKTLEVEKTSLQEEHDRLMERQSLLLQELAGKEKSWRSRFEEQEKRAKKQEETMEQGAEKVAQETEVLRQKHNQELELARNNYTQELSRLKAQIDVAENEIIRLQFVLQKEQELRKYAEDVAGQHPAQQERLDISQIEREAAEGQEVEPPGPGAAALHASPLPLELLLAQTDQQGLPDRDSSRSAASSRQGGSDRQLAHLSALLAESEAHNGRLEKLTEVLKEEIRTYQRSEERHKHIENLEYVKNVILKFLMLGGEERARLIPVLSTILRLSREEVTQLQQLTKEEEDKSNAEGWGSYLHLWSTP